MTIYNHKNEMRQKKQLLTHLLTQNAETGVWQSGIASAHTQKKHLHPSCKCFISNVINQ